MKKTNRIRLLIASTAVLGASILIPTLLTACSTASDNNNNNNGQQQVIDQALMDKITEVNKENNKNTRKSIYQEYMFELNKSNSRTNKALDLPQAPKKDYLGVVTKRLKDIVTTDKFVEEFVQMIETELDTTGGPNTIPEAELTKLVDKLKEKDPATGKYKITELARLDGPGSVWGPKYNAFMFNDTYNSSVNYPTWKYRFTWLNTTYTFELYLTDDVDFKFEPQGEKVSVQITNLNSDPAKRLKLHVYSKTVDAQNNTTSETKTDLYFKDGPINLPGSLFEEFDKFFKTRNTYFNNYIDFLNVGSSTYFDIAAKGINTSATIWNQFMLENYENLSKIINDDLITNKDNSQLIKWLETNCSIAEGASGTNVVAELKSNLKNFSGAANPDSKDNIAQLTPIFIQGKNVNQKVLTNNRLAINLPGNKLYAIDLYPTEFKFVPEVNKFFGYIDSYGFTTNPTLTFSSNSEISSYIKTTNDGSQTSTKQNTNKITPNKPIDVNTLFNANNVFSKYISSSLDSGNQGITNKLLDKQLDPNSNLLDTFANKYFSQNGKALLTAKPELLSRLIFDNIDLDNMVYYTQSTGGNNISSLFNKNNEAKWREIVQQWLSQATLTVQQSSVGTYMSKSNIQIYGDFNKELKLDGLSGADNSIATGKKISQINIYFGSKEGVTDVLANMANTSTSTVQSSLFINPKKPSNLPTESTLVNNVDSMMSDLGNNAWVIFKEKGSSSSESFYAFYMGINKETVDNKTQQSTSPIVIPSELISTPEFLKEFIGK